MTDVFTLVREALQAQRDFDPARAEDAQQALKALGDIEVRFTIHESRFGHPASPETVIREALIERYEKPEVHGALASIVGERDNAVAELKGLYETMQEQLCGATAILETIRADSRERLFWLGYIAALAARLGFSDPDVDGVRVALGGVMDEVYGEPHEPDDCRLCGGGGYVKLPVGCDPELDCEDEDNCWCGCHEVKQT